MLRFRKMGRSDIEIWEPFFREKEYLPFLSMNITMSEK